jgi:hypothetical protein
MGEKNYCWGRVPSGCHVGFLGKGGGYAGFHSPAFYELWGTGWEKCGLSFSYIIPNGWISHCPNRKLHERNSPGTDVSFSLFSFAAAASLGIVPEYGFHLALYDIYSPQKAACHSRYPRTGE